MEKATRLKLLKGTVPMVTIKAHVSVSTNEFPRYDSSLQSFNYLNKTRFIIIHELLLVPNHIHDSS